MIVEHERSKPEYVSRYQTCMYTKHEGTQLYESNLKLI